ncbi:deoxyribonuclease IV [Hippea jasoniae]|uniref:deoxyribonuclease IV n=1 Tax=Hippea jasoniae TaxID=944479 RepID=UPI00054EEF6F|nr:deoxyribonuclease IV [Hippea jasoniae]
MKYFGAHVSAQGGVSNAPVNAHKINATAFALFLKNQRRWQAKPLTPHQINAFKENIKRFNFNSRYILPHASYLINLCSPNEEKLKKSRLAFIDELKRAQFLGLKYLNVHPGAHLNQISEKECIDKMAESINLALKSVENVIVVLENTAGEGSVYGYRFKQLRNILEKIEDNSRIGVCIDTCHLFAAGYNISTFEGFNKTFEEFSEIIGFKYLKGMHLNDSKVELGKRVDRHESLGKGKIGLEAFKLIARDNRFDEIPLILETPNPSIWKDEIALLNKFYSASD